MVPWHVPVWKKNGQVCISVELTQLNESVKRELHPLLVIEHVLAQLAGAKVFFKLDANSEFYRIPLDPRLAKLTTFITPFGRYYYNRLPFGITSEPEHFHKRILEILTGVTENVGMINDVLISAKTRRNTINTSQWLLERFKELG